VGRDQIRQIAGYVVDRLRTRAEPFPDMASFVNSGLLRDAIDQVNTGGTPTGPEINDGVFDYANVYLTQNDILTKLAPHAAARSDTFRIRTYGAVTGPDGEVAGRARLEAVVQRLPDKVDGSDPMTPATDLLNMRDYRIVSLRWLTDEDV
jgi:hypothetical protein